METNMGWIMLVSTIVIMIGLGGLMAYNLIPSTRFKNVFGFKPTTPGSSMYVSVVEQETNAVEAQLKKLATNFRNSCTREGSYTREKVEGNPTTKAWRINIRKHKKQIKSNASTVQYDKKKFWHAHKLAERKNFPVYNKVGDYYS